MKKFLIIAGEISGDLHGSNLVKSIKELNPETEFFGIGGERMKTSGVDLIYHINSLSFMGFVEVIKHIPYLKKVKRHLIELVKERKPDAVILIDYPGFNLSFAKDVHRFNKKIFYYISPQIWAWGKRRIHLIKKLIYKMIVVFPFEEILYRDHDVDAEFVGHPLIELIDNYNYQSKEVFFNQNSLDLTKPLLAIFPGSRKQEIKKILPEIKLALDRLREEFQINFAIAGVESIPNELYRKYLSDDYKVIMNQNYELMKYADFGIIKSGTSTLEAALFEMPFIVVYKTSFLSYHIGKRLIQIDNISLANIVAGEKVVEELIQKYCNPDRIYSEIKNLILNENKRLEIKNNLRMIRQNLGKSKASKKAASIILNEL